MKNITKFIMVLAVSATIVSCADSKKANVENLVATEWTLDSVVTEVVGVPLSAESVVTIMFSDSTSFAGNRGCNQYFGTFTTEVTPDSEDIIAIETKGRTMAMCPNLNFEDSYIKALDDVATFTAEDDKLIMINSKGDVSLIFVPTKK